jgi:cytochrome c-type biogenesis protein CcmE
MAQGGGTQAAVSVLTLLLLFKINSSGAFSTPQQQQKQRHSTRLRVGGSYLDSLSSQTYSSNNVNGNSYNQI